MRSSNRTDGPCIASLCLGFVELSLRFATSSVTLHLLHVTVVLVWLLIPGCMRCCSWKHVTVNLLDLLRKLAEKAGLQVQDPPEQITLAAPFWLHFRALQLTPPTSMAGILLDLLKKLAKKLGGPAPTGGHHAGCTIF